MLARPPLSTSRRVLSSWRGLSTHPHSTAWPKADDDVQVPCGSAGSISLQLYNLSSQVGSDPSPIILHLPSGFQSVRSLPCPVDNDAVVHRLAAASQELDVTLVRLNYRIGNGFQHPTPVHDVLAGYDWVLENLVARTNETSRRRRPARLGVCGQLVGGSLAMMLALTESKMGTDGVAAAAVHEPILDWIFPASTSDQEPASYTANIGTPQALAASIAASSTRRRARARKTASSWVENAQSSLLPAAAVLQARSEYFRKPHQWLDPFASPILFFRTAGVELAPEEQVPDNRYMMAWNTFEDTNSSASSFAVTEDHVDLEHDPDAAFDVLPGHASFSQPGSNGKAAVLEPRRVAHRVYPPQGSTLRLPHTRISTSPSSILHDQANEMARLMQRSWVRSSLREAGMTHQDALEEGDRALAQRDAEQSAAARMVVSSTAAGGIWGVGDGWQDDVAAVVKWLAHRLR